MAKLLSSIQRRDFPRYATDIPLPISLTTLKNKVETKGKTINISKKGFCIKLDTDLSISEKVELTLILNNKKFVNKGRVIWSDPKLSLYGINLAEYQETVPEYWDGYLLGLEYSKKMLERRTKKDRREKKTTKKIFNNRKTERRLNYPFFIKSKRSNIVKNLENNDVYTYYREFQGTATTTIMKNGQKLINFGSNNYLGLAFNKEIKTIGSEAVKEYGISLCGTRVFSGNRDIHIELEKKIAKFKRTDGSIIFANGYMANLAIISSFANKNDFILIDEQDHASIIDGCVLSKANMISFKHNDMNDLEKKLKKIGKYSSKVIITEGVFSMDGDLGNLPEIYRLGEEYNSPVFVDDAHGLGVLGENGRGTINHFGLEGKISLSTGTLSKSLGAIGGFVAASDNLIYTLRHYARTFFFTTALPVATCLCIIKALDIIEKNKNLVKNLQNNFNFLRQELLSRGFKLTNTQSAIIPIITGDEVIAHGMAKELEEKGIFVNAVGYPAVKKKEARLRISVMSTHTKEDLKYFIDKLTEISFKYGVIK
jgi:glycine C-acetyltransferase